MEAPQKAVSTRVGRKGGVPTARPHPSQSSLGLGLGCPTCLLGWLQADMEPGNQGQPAGRASERLEAENREKEIPALLV